MNVDTPSLFLALRNLRTYLLDLGDSDGVSIDHKIVDVTQFRSWNSLPSWNALPKEKQSDIKYIIQTILQIPMDMEEKNIYTLEAISSIYDHIFCVHGNTANMHATLSRALWKIRLLNIQQISLENILKEVLLITTNLYLTCNNDNKELFEWYLRAALQTVIFHNCSSVSRRMKILKRGIHYGIQTVCRKYSKETYPSSSYQLAEYDAADEEIFFSVQECIQNMETFILVKSWHNNSNLPVGSERVTTYQDLQMLLQLRNYLLGISNAPFILENYEMIQARTELEIVDYFLQNDWNEIESNNHWKNLSPVAKVQVRTNFEEILFFRYMQNLCPKRTNVYDEFQKFKILNLSYKEKERKIDFKNVIEEIWLVGFMFFLDHENKNDNNLFETTFERALNAIAKECSIELGNARMKKFNAISRNMIAERCQFYASKDGDNSAVLNPNSNFLEHDLSMEEIILKMHICIKNIARSNLFSLTTDMNEDAIKMMEALLILQMYLLGWSHYEERLEAEVVHRLLPGNWKQIKNSKNWKLLPLQMQLMIYSTLTSFITKNKHGNADVILQNAAKNNNNQPLVQGFSDNYGLLNYIVVRLREDMSKTTSMYNKIQQIRKECFITLLDEYLNGKKSMFSLYNILDMIRDVTPVDNIYKTFLSIDEVTRTQILKKCICFSNGASNSLVLTSETEDEKTIWMIQKCIEEVESNLAISAKDLQEKTKTLRLFRILREYLFGVESHLYTKKKIDLLLSKEVDTQCSICLLEEGELFITSCGHTFHLNCILQWINEQHHSCPICRELTSKEQLEVFVVKAKKQ